MASASVIICTRDRARSLARTLQSLKFLIIPDPRAFELIIVDNGSTDATCEMIQEFRAEAPFAVQQVSEMRAGLSFARNAGIAAAKGDIILFTDDDCFVATDWVGSALDQFADHSRKIVAGRVLLFNPEHLDVTRRVDTEPDVLKDPDKLAGFLMGANMAFGRAVLDAIGGFDVRFGAGTALRSAEDTEFVYRAFVAGVPVVYRPEMLVHHDHRRVGRQTYLKLVSGYHFGTGAMIAKHALRGDCALVKAYYWECWRAYRLWRKGLADLRTTFVIGAAVFGAARFLCMECWRRPFGSAAQVDGENRTQRPA